MSQLPTELRLISPFSALECKKQIAARDEERTFLAFRGQQRIATRTLTDDEGNYIFEIFRAPKSKLEFNAGMWSVRIKGMICQKRDKTLVIAHVETSKAHIILMIFVLFLTFISFYVIFQNLFITDVTTFNIIFGLGFGALCAWVFWFYDNEKRLLLRILRQCIGETAQEISPEQAAIYGIG